MFPCSSSKGERTGGGGGGIFHVLFAASARLGPALSVVGVGRASAKLFSLGRRSAPTYPASNFGQETGTEKLLSLGVLGEGADAAHRGHLLHPTGVQTTET